MKQNAIFSKQVRPLLMGLIILCQSALLLAQSEKSRTVEKTFDGKTALWVSHRYGNLTIKKSDGNQIKAVLTISASSKDVAELQSFLNRFDLEATEAADNKIDLKTSDIIKTWQTTVGHSKIKLCDGSNYSGIKDFNMNLEIQVPKLRYATLENKYADITVAENIASALEIVLFEGSLTATGSYENLMLNLKYSKGTIGQYEACKGSLFECKLNMGNGRSLMMDAKYSGLKTGHISNGKFNFFETELEGQNAERIMMEDSKYSEIKFDELELLHFESSFEDKVDLKKVGSLSATKSKYSNYKVGGLWKSLDFPSSFEDEIQVINVGSSFKGFVLEGKYTDVQLPIPPSVKYKIEAEMKYGKLIYPENMMESSTHKEKDEQLSVKGVMKGADANPPSVRIKSFEGTIRLQ